MSNQRKNTFLLLGFLALLFISYQISIKKTFAIKTQVTRLEKERDLLSNATHKIFLLQQENKYLDSILTKNNLSIESSFQQTLLEKLTAFAKKQSVDIISFKDPHSFKNNTMTLKTYAFEVKGYFNALLLLTNEIEKQQLGRLISVNFVKKKNYRRNRNELIGQFFIQKLNQ